jgi:putative chitinase
MLRPIQLLARVAPQAQPAYVQAFAGGEAALAAAGIDTPPRLAHFMAQVLHETGRGSVLFESLDYTTPARILAIFGVGNHSAAVRAEELPGLVGNAPALAERVYGLGNPRMAAELGNTAPGDGFRFRGGGLLQTTGRGNYRRMGAKAGADFEADPGRIVDPACALAPALAEWSEGGLNDAADRDDIVTITRVINGGLNGLDERRALYAELRPLLDGDGGADIAWLQDALNRYGASPALQVDGQAGPATAAATAWFQAGQGLPADGVAGPATWAALRALAGAAKTG